MNFFDKQGTFAGGIAIKFSSSLKYRMRQCQSEHTEFQNEPDDTNKAKVWSITKLRPGPRIIVLCSMKKVLDLELSSSSCDGVDDGVWTGVWAKEVAQIGLEFPSDVPVFYRAVPGNCTL